MGLVADIVTFKTGTGAATTTIEVAVDLGGLTPVVVWAWMVGRTDDVNAVGARDIVLSYGFGVSTTSRRCLPAQSDSGVTPSAADKTIRNDALLMSISTAGAIDGAMDINALSANNVQLIVDTQFPADYTCILVAMAGTDITSATIVDFSKSTTSGAGIRDLSLGVVPKYMETISVQSATAIGTAAPSASIVATISRTVVAPAANQCLFFESSDNVAASDSLSYCNDAESIIGLATATSIGTRGTVTGPSDAGDGVKIDYAENTTAATKYAALILTGPFRVAIGSTSTVTDASTVAVDPGFIPVLTALWSHCNVESTLDSMQNGAEVSLGAFLGQTGSKQFSQGLNEPDNVNPTAGETFLRVDAPYANTDGAGAEEGVMEIITPAPLPATAWTFQMSNADSAANFVLWASFGEASDVTRRMHVGRLRRGGVGLRRWN